MTGLDKYWVEKIKAGDKTAEDDVLRHLRPTVFSIVRKCIGKNRAEADDLIQNILYGALIKLREGAYNPDKASLRNWAAGIAYNQLRDYWKKQKLEFTVESLPDEAVNPGNQEDLEREEIRNQLRKKLKKLPGKYQEVLYLRFFQGLKVSEISEKINLPPRRVSERINYALRLLRKKLRKEEMLSMLRGLFLIIYWSPSYGTFVAHAGKLI